MADVINLRQFRRRRRRQQEEVAAAENRVRHGRTKADRELEGKLAEKQRRDVEGHRRTTARERPPEGK